MECEIWKDIPGYEGEYQVSNLGNVRSIKVKELKPCKHKTGYYRVELFKNGKGKTHLVHRLVYSAFTGVIPDDMVINHKDEDKGNNTLDNLMLCTQKDNCNWGTAIERRVKKLINHKNMSKWVVQLNNNNEILHFYPSTKEAQRQTDIPCNKISECCNGKRQTAGGYLKSLFHYLFDCLNMNPRQCFQPSF